MCVDCAQAQRTLLHLGFDEEIINGVHQSCGRRTPSLPEKEADKLIRVLEEYANIAFLPPICQQKDSIPYGDFGHMDDSDREAYSIQIDLIQTDLDLRILE